MAILYFSFTACSRIFSQSAALNFPFSVSLDASKIDGDFSVSIACLYPLAGAILIFPSGFSMGIGFVKVSIPPILYLVAIAI